MNKRLATSKLVLRAGAGLSIVLAMLLSTASISSAQDSFKPVVDSVQPKMVKINGSGGFRGLESYQSGLLISAEGHILTVWSYVLDSDVITVTLNNGQRHEATLLGYDPRIEIAILKIDGDELPNFNVDESVEARIGSTVLAFSNLFGIATGSESTSVLHGIIAAKTKLTARSGAMESNYRGNVYIVDAMINNPGAAGGAVTDRNGQLIGIIGKELKDQRTNTWLNFSIPISELAGSIHDIRSGKMVVDAATSRQPPAEPMTPKLLGFALVPNVVSKTPPFIDQVVEGTAFDRAGIRPDDLIVEIGGKMTPSCNDVLRLLSLIDRDATMSVTYQRGRRFYSIDIQLNR